ncbi:MAG TPA: sigma factor-like helix-turn-helix DNA-binding protein, partial [Leptospiraceae bacterium]|nr:sigma factor-like helix-turn-helix DNA-binding protein [Leptospiraceae bacterium]
MLEPMYRQVIDLRYYEELSYSEIADLLKCNVGTVKSRIFKAKELLKHLILNDEKEK